jgi:acetyl esterase
VVDAELQPILDAMVRPTGHVPVEQMRAGHRAETEQLAGTGPAVPTKNTSFPGPAGAPVPVRVYEPPTARGTTVYFHGGGWVVGNLDSVDAACRALAVHSDTRVVSVDYRLAPEHPYPAAVEDARAAVRWAQPDVVAGDSAGGNLAAIVAREARFQLLIYPVTDAGLNTPSYAEFGEGNGLRAEDMRRFWNLYLDGADGFAPDASPLRGDLAGLPPAYVLTAEHDVLRDDGEQYAQALRDAGVPVTLDRRAGALHGFWRWQSTEIGRRTVREVGEALRSALDALDEP